MDIPQTYYTCPRCKHRVPDPDPCECDEITDDELDEAESAEEDAREAEWEAMESRRSCREIY